MPRRNKSLAAGRPPTAQSTRASLSSQATRTLIRTHHALHKQLTAAKAQGDETKSSEIQAKIDSLGGLERYQQASIQGQSTERGGDSSIVLIKFLEAVLPDLEEWTTTIKLLEVGALSVDNACSKSKLFAVQRIDLNSQAEGILQQDFMERPLPANRDEKFDIISLSLVLNYVPDNVQRGEMLRRIRSFLQHQGKDGDILPALFLVLPAACVTNSRYFDDATLYNIMTSLGYVEVKRKQTAKLAYYLFHLTADLPLSGNAAYGKKEIRSGATRNNFSVALKSAPQPSAPG
ncbi:25S rRNA (adenine2142-N1)-methyltransferase [Oleoguttula sp. CCFEE 5521]